MKAPSVAADRNSVQHVLFKVLADQSPRPILITDDVVEVVYVNRAWEKRFGYSLAEMMGKNPNILRSSKTPPNIYTRMWATLRAGKAFQTDKIIDRRKNGRAINLFTTMFPVEAQKKTYYVQILDDITRRKHLEEYQSTFIKVAAHDIRSPLAVLQLTSDLLAMRAQDHAYDNDLQADIQSMQEEIARASHLVTTLLDISLFESGKVKLRLENVRMRTLIDEVIEHGHKISPKKKFSVKSDDAISIYADRERIRQVLINLLENAIKHASGRHAIIISATEKDDAVIVSVLDRGPGISKAASTKIFQPFYRVPSTKKTKAAGHGLGLHIVDTIIKAHHGHAWVEPRKGGGSVFSFTLPLKTRTRSAKP